MMIYPHLKSGTASPDFAIFHNDNEQSNSFINEADSSLTGEKHLFKILIPFEYFFYFDLVDLMHQGKTDKEQI